MKIEIKEVSTVTKENEFLVEKHTEVWLTTEKKEYMYTVKDDFKSADLTEWILQLSNKFDSVFTLPSELNGFDTVEITYQLPRMVKSESLHIIDYSHDIKETIRLAMDILRELTQGERVVTENVTTYEL